MAEKYRYDAGRGYEDNETYAHNNQLASSGERPGGYDDADVFGHEESHDVSKTPTH